MPNFALCHAPARDRTGPLTALRRLASNWRRRRRLRHIAELGDHILKDIGINRHDVQTVLSQPLSADPVEELDRRSRLRRKQALPDATRRWLQDGAYLHPGVDDPGG